MYKVIIRIEEYWFRESVVITLTLKRVTLHYIKYINNILYLIKEPVTTIIKF